MEIKDQEKIHGRLCAMGRAKYHEMLVDGPGYSFTKDGFHWELDPVDQDQYGLTAEALNDCIEQLDKMGSAQDLKKTAHVRQAQGWFNSGIVITSKIDPRIVCAVTLVDQDYEQADVNLRWYLDLFRVSPSASGPAERSVDAEELKSVERAHDMAKEIKESLDSLFQLPFSDSSKAKKAISESFDGWGLPVVEDVVDGVTGHVGIDAIETPEAEEGGKDRKEMDAEGKIKTKLTSPDVDPSKRPHVDGEGQPQLGGTDVEADLAGAKVKPGTPEQEPKHVSEDATEKDTEKGMVGHVGLKAVETPKSKEGDKDRGQADGAGKLKVKLASPDVDPSKRPHVDGEGQREIGGTDKLTALKKGEVKPGTPEQAPKHVSEALRQRRMRQYESYKARKSAEAKKKSVSESVQHPLKAVESLKKDMEEAHRAAKKAHHLVEFAHRRMTECCGHLPSAHADMLKQHDDKMHAAKSHLHEAKKHMSECSEAVSSMHMGMKKK